jgi:hypothetical protein
MRITNNKSGRDMEINDVVFVNNISYAGKLLPDNHTLFKQGAYEKESAVVSVGVANRLGVKVGDLITVDWSTFGMQNYSVSYLISGIIYEGAYGQRVLADIDPIGDMLNHIVNTLGEPEFFYSELYVSSVTGMVDHSLIDEQLQIVTLRSEILANEESIVRALNVTTQKYGAVALYLLLVFGYVMMRIRQDNKYYSTLAVIGAPKIILYVNIFIGNFIIFTFVTICAMIIVYWYFRAGMGFYMPSNMLFQLATYSLLCNLLVLMFASWLSAAKLDKLSHANLLKI